MNISKLINGVSDILEFHDGTIDVGRNEIDGDKSILDNENSIEPVLDVDIAELNKRV